MKKSYLLVILGNLTAFGPFVTDFYLPCLPELARVFSCTTSAIQVSLTTGMIGLAVGQIIIGTISDKYGRRLPLLWCLLLFALSTVGCMMSRSILPFITFRLLQGLFGASGMVISKAIVSDSFTKDDFAKYFAILAAVQGIAPIIAPVVGGASYSLISWQGTFGVLCGWSILLFLSCLKLKETLAVEDRNQKNIFKSFSGYIELFCNRRFMVMMLLAGFTSASLMAYISASPFIFQEHFGLTPMVYSVVFAFNALGLVAGAAIVVKLKNMHKAVRFGCEGLLFCAIVASLFLIIGMPIVFFEIPIWGLLFCVGMNTPLSITLGMKVVEANKGMASALLGAMPFLLGGIVAPLTGLGNILYSTSLLMIICTLICMTLYLMGRREEY